MITRTKIKAAAPVCALIVFNMHVFEQNWLTGFAMDRPHAGTLSQQSGTKPVTKRLARWIGHINLTKHDKQYCLVVNKIEDCKLGLLQDGSFAESLQNEV